MHLTVACPAQHEARAARAFISLPLQYRVTDCAFTRVVLFDIFPTALAPHLFDVCVTEVAFLAWGGAPELGECPLSFFWRGRFVGTGRVCEGKGMRDTNDFDAGGTQLEANVIRQRCCGGVEARTAVYRWEGRQWTRGTSRSAIRGGRIGIFFTAFAFSVDKDCFTRV